MKRQQWTPGAIVSIELTPDLYAFAQLLPNYIAAFYHFFSPKKEENVAEIVKSPVIFYMSVYRSAVASGRWVKIGKTPPPGISIFDVPNQFIQDAITKKDFSLYNMATGEVTPASREQCIGLERTSVWEDVHIEERLTSFYLGKPSFWVEQLKLEGATQ